ncbi:MAG: VOC family protein [Pseudomonadota bacterium]
MGHITGIGGIFFKAKDPDALAAWYHTHLGLPLPPRSYEAEVWQQAQGPTIFAPFARDTDYFGRPEQHFMLNFRVRDMEGLMGKLRAAGIDVIRDETSYPNGRFARLHDPEGNPIELWEPG